MTNNKPEDPALQTVHLVSVVVPVYQGEATLAPLLAEIEPLTQTQRSAAGRPFRVAEVILVHDGAVDNSGKVMETMAQSYPFVKLIWLSRHFGQHPAILAGAASTTSEWVVTLDEDGEQNPADIGSLLDRALATGAQLVYARPTNPLSHGRRSWLGAFARRVLAPLLVNDPAILDCHSFRLVDGEIARSLAAYCGHNAHLDVALSWVVARTTQCPVTLRSVPKGRSGPGYRGRASHFSRLVLTSGSRPLRLISLLGILAILGSLVGSAVTVGQWLTGGTPVQGWTFLTILLCLFSGCLLFALGVIAEYLGMLLSMALGRPLFLVVSRPKPGKDECS